MQLVYHIELIMIFLSHVTKAQSILRPLTSVYWKCRTIAVEFRAKNQILSIFKVFFTGESSINSHYSTICFQIIPCPKLFVLSFNQSSALPTPFANIALSNFTLNKSYPDHRHTVSIHILSWAELISIIGISWKITAQRLWFR